MNNWRVSSLSEWISEEESLDELFESESLSDLTRGEGDPDEIFAVPRSGLQFDSRSVPLA